MGGLFGPNPRKVIRNQFDHFDWREEFYVWFRFYKIYKLMVNFHRKPVNDKGKLINDLKNGEFHLSIIIKYMENYNC